MDAAPPLVINTPKLEEILYKKEHILTKKKIQYKLIMYMDKEFIYFKINEINNFSLFYFENKYNYDNIIEILELDNNIFINLEIVFEFIEEEYLNKNLKLTYDKENNINLKIKIIKENQIKKKYIIPLKKQKLGLKDKFSIIINEINNLKKQKNKEINEHKFQKLQMLLEYLQTSTNKLLEKNTKKLNTLKETVNNNEKKIIENKNKILSFKNQIKEIEDIIKINNNNNNINANNNINNQNNENNQIINKNKEEELKIEKLYNYIDSYSLLYKIIIIGNSYTGKTWIIDSFISYPVESFGTTGFDTKNCFMKINETIIKLIITDCPGVEKYFMLCQTKTTDKDLIMFVYSINDKLSFNIIKNRVEDVKKYCKNKPLYFLVGSKSDLENERKISYEEGQELANKEKMDFFIEVSAKLNFNISELFFVASKMLFKKKKI